MITAEWPGEVREFCPDSGQTLCNFVLCENRCTRGQIFLPLLRSEPYLRLYPTVSVAHCILITLPKSGKVGKKIALKMQGNLSEQIAELLIESPNLVMSNCICRLQNKYKSNSVCSYFDVL